MTVYALHDSSPYHGNRPKDPTISELEDPLFDVIWQTIKNWDVDTNGEGYHGATGNEAAAILRSIRASHLDLSDIQEAPQRYARQAAEEVYMREAGRVRERAMDKAVRAAIRTYVDAIKSKS